jgi:secreted trypsin-like serine protease
MFVIGEDSCDGDSGGPLMLEEKDRYRKKYTLFGLVSWGAQACATKSLPGVYTDVASFSKWILDNIE